MAQDEDRLIEENSNINGPSVTISELPGKPFALTMEVPLFLTMLGLSLSGTAISNIILYRTCVHSLHHTPDECRIFLAPEKNNETRQLEEEVQKYAAFVQMVKTVIESVGPAILSLFLGVWSDTHGRKPLVVWPLFGTATSAMLMVLFSSIEGLGPWWYIVTLLPNVLTGGFRILLVGMFTYISDISSTSSVSFRMTVLEASVSVGSVIGSLSSSYLLRAVGNVYMLLIVTTLYVIAYVFTNVYLRESLNGAVQGGITTVLDFLLVKEMFRDCFKKRPNNLRAQLLLLVMANSLSIFILYGLFGLEYMYTREKLHWALKDYTMFSAVSTTISFTGSFIGVGLIQKLLPVSDLAFAMISFLSTSGEYMMKAFATVSWHMYLAPAISLFGGLSAPLIRSMLTKILPVEDIAKAFALICAIEGICPLISPIVYNALYRATITEFPGAIFVLTSCITGICTVMLGFVAYYRTRSTTPSYQAFTNE